MKFIKIVTQTAYVLDSRCYKSCAMYDDNCRTEIVLLKQVRLSVWRQIITLQGAINAYYLKYRYGGPKTYLLTAFAGERLVHVQWLVPAERIHTRYPFVSSGSYAIIACITASDFRGKGIYTAQLQRAVTSGIPAVKYWIWTTAENVPSRRGIEKACGRVAGTFTQTRYAFGIISRCSYKAMGDVCEY